jgi:DsbC/DsbD-like thiol-disulfide interchange protein
MQDGYTQSVTPDKVVEIKAKQIGNVSPAGIADVEIILNIKKGWHINANKPLDNNFIPTVVLIKDSSNIKVVKTIYPAPKITKLQFSDSQMALYEDQAVIQIQLKIIEQKGKGTVKLGGEVQYQPCNNQTCLFTVSKAFSLDIKPKKTKN